MASLVVQAQALAEDLLADLPRRLAHVRGVAGRADELRAPLSDGDAVAVVSAAWVHDIGYSARLAKTGFHPVDGARFLRAEGFDETVVRLVAHHSGAEVEAEERGLSADLVEFARPSEHLLDFVTCADMQTGPTGLPVDVRDRLDEILRRYGPDDPVHRAITRSGPALIAAVDRVTALLAAQ
ncbi:HD domain-containing protein [Tsukamurella paurometabola]|uniref:HD domain-containing protein n=1 Tax=Tsukamurella paurometabola TaxID=2061 RepID=A0ABS5NFC8_TSUPA|nr:HD domain-containing protein [Tsukamurella paurometabola]MBS4102994.1 HD domain-containing protein [Tsukamurella paurometabola]